MKEYVILQLRLEKGVDTQAFYQRFHVAFMKLFATEVKTLLQNQLLQWDPKEQYISLTKRGREVANIVWEKFI